MILICLKGFRARYQLPLAHGVITFGAKTKDTRLLGSKTALGIRHQGKYPDICINNYSTVPLEKACESNDPIDC
jgi:hypothetical protein